MHAGRAAVLGRDRVDYASLIILILIGGALRFAFLFQPMRLDETANYTFLASSSLRTLTCTYPAPNNHALHTLFVHLFTVAFGSSPAVIRATAFVAGALVIPAAYVTLAEIFDARAALLGAALVTASSPLVEYATNARGYTLQALLVLVVFFAAARLLRAPTRGGWIALGAASVLGFYTIPTMAYFVASALLWMLASAAAGDSAFGLRRMTIRLVGIGSAVAVTVALLYLPFVLGSGLAAVTSNRWVKPLPWSEFRTGLLPNLIAYLETWQRGLPMLANSMVMAGFLLSLVLFRRLSRFKVSPVVVAGATCLTLMTIQRVLPPGRVWLPLLPLYLGASAAGLWWGFDRVSSLVRARAVPSPIVGAALAVLVGGAASASLLATGSPYQAPDQVTFRDAESLTEILGGILRDDDAVYAHNDARLVLRYYFDRHHVPTRYIYEPGRNVRGIGRAFAIDSSAEYPAFTFKEALNASNLSRSKEYDIVVLAHLPSSTLLQVLNPELASKPP
jgi:hypothetical protein